MDEVSWHLLDSCRVFLPIAEPLIDLLDVLLHHWHLLFFGFSNFASRTQEGPAWVQLLGIGRSLPCKSLCRGVAADRAALEQPARSTLLSMWISKWRTRIFVFFRCFWGLAKTIWAGKGVCMIRWLLNAIHSTWPKAACGPAMPFARFAEVKEMNQKRELLAELIEACSI